MKVQFKQPYDDGSTVFQQFAVIETDDTAGNRLITEGVAVKVPDDTRLFVSEHLITDCVPTGEKISLGELTEGKKK